MPPGVTVRTPSTIGNFGPGFDVTSLALDWGGDTLEARPANEDRLTLDGPGHGTIPTTFDDNCAAAAYAYLRNAAGDDAPVHLHIKKGVRPGSGLGSSASSAAAGALAFAALHRDRDWDALTLVQAATYGESRAAGAHGDDVAAAVQGGLSIVGADAVTRVTPPDDLFLAITLPDLVLETRTMRAAVGETVGVTAAVANLANVAFMVDAMHRGDVAAIAGCLSDAIATPARRAHVPFFDAVRKAAVDAGAAGIAISGSGPALFTVAQGLSTARDLAAAMTEAVVASGTQAEAIACQAERRHVWKEALA